MDSNEILYKTLEKENILLKENYEKIIEKIREENEKTIKELKDEYEKHLKVQEENNIQLREELDAIKNSRSYKFYHKLKRIVKK